MQDIVTSKAPATVHTKQSEDYPRHGSVYEPKHVARNTNNACSKLWIVYDCIILKYYSTYEIPHFSLWNSALALKKSEA